MMPGHDRTAVHALRDPGERLRKRLVEREGGLVAARAPDRKPVTEDEIADLPGPVRRYLRYMGVVGRPRDWSFRARFAGRFRMRPNQPWMPCVAWQYNAGSPVTRLFHMRVDFAGRVPMTGWDTYRDGQGRMVGRLLNTIKVANGEGQEFDSGELVTWLNDAVLLAPSMLLVPAVTWSEVDDHTFEVALADAGRTVAGRVTIDESGAPVEFTTSDRYATLPGGLLRAQWTTPVLGWTVEDSRPRPHGASAVWHLPDGHGGIFTYAEGEFTDVEYNVAPGQARQQVTPAIRRQPLTEALAGAAQIAACLVGAPFLRRWYNRWGTTPAERVATLPGDELVLDPKLGYTRAVTIDAPPDVVWPWLVQIGQGRGGLYSYDALENLVGCDIHSTDLIQGEHQQLAVGDLIRLGPDGFPCFAVASVDPPSSLVLVGADPKTHAAPLAPISAGMGGATWQWGLRPTAEGRTRLVVRQRLTYPRRQSAVWHLVEPVAFVMERRMLRGIKARAEGTESQEPAGQPTAGDHKASEPERARPTAAARTSPAG